MVWLPITLSVLIEVVIVALAIRRLFRGPRYSPGEGLQLLGNLPAAPSLLGTAYLFPGRGTPPDPDVREAAATLVDRRADPPLPPGIRRSQDASGD
ncbi:MAG: hypothetical protein ACRDKE_09360 [Solirubrobacterales bacterium]